MVVMAPAAASTGADDAASPWKGRADADEHGPKSLWMSEASPET